MKGNRWEVVSESLVMAGPLTFVARKFYIKFM